MKSKFLVPIFLVIMVFLPSLVFAQEPTTTSFSFEDPLGKGGVLADLVNVVISWAFNLGIPIVVAVIIWAGLKMMLSRGNETKVGEAKKMLWWAIVGLAIILIGSGFVNLIKSILLIP